MVRTAAAGRKRKKQQKHDRLSSITRVVKVAAGAVLVVGILFGAGYLADVLFFAQDVRVDKPVGLMPYSGSSGENPGPRSDTPAESTAPSKLSFYTTLLQKEEQSAKPDTLRSQVPQRLPRPPDTLPTPGVQQQARYKIQLGSFKNQRGAEAFSAELKKKGYQSYIMKAAEPGQEIVYRVRIGNFASLEEAQQAAAEIEKREALNPFITSR